MLEGDGVRAITTSCGYLSIYQRELAAAVSVPLFSSSLFQVPLAARVIRPDQRVGILTARAVLTERHFQGPGWSSSDIDVFQMALPMTVISPRPCCATPRGPILYSSSEKSATLHDRRCASIRTPAPSCWSAPTSLRSHRGCVEQAGVPVFDLYTLVMHAHLTTIGSRSV
jgi:hypothetical protein